MPDNHYHNDVIVSGGNLSNENFLALCVGDVNGSYIPPASGSTGYKSEAKVSLDLKNIIKLNANEYFELPLKVSQDLSVGTISLIISYPKELVSIYNVQCAMDNEVNNFAYNIKGDELRVGWFENENALNFKSGDPIIIIRGKITIIFNTPYENLDIFNTLGEKILSKTINENSLSNKNQIEMSDLPEGVYFMKCTSVNSTVVKKIVISK